MSAGTATRRFRFSCANSQDTIAETVRVMMSNEVFIDVAAAAPSSKPTMNMRELVSCPPVSTTSDKHHSATQRLSVRYSIDFRKKTGKSESRMAAQMPTVFE